MASRLFLAIIIMFCTSNSSFSQTKSYSDIMPKDIQANPILDSSSYLPDSLRQTVFSILKSKGFDLTKCFCDKRIDLNEKNKTISIIIWDIDDLKDRKKFETSKKIIPFESTHPKFYSGTIEYDIKSKSVKFYEDQ